MKPLAWLLLVVVCLSPACGNDDAPTKPKPGPLATLSGTYDLQTWVYTRTDDPAVHVDWVAQDGLAGTLTIAESGGFTVTPALPGGFGQDFGTLTLQADSLYWDGENDEQWVGFSLNAALLTLDWREVELVDMDHDGQPEDVRLQAAFQRR